MPSVTLNEVQSLIDKIEELRKAIETAGNVGRTKIKDLGIDDVLAELPRKNGKVVEAEWNKKKPADKDDLTHRLSQIRDSLQAASGQDGPSDPDHIMHAVHASNSLIAIWGLLAGILIIVNLTLVVLYWGEATGTALPDKVSAAVQALEAVEGLEEGVKDADTALVEAQRVATGGDGPQKAQAEQALSEARKKSAARRTALATAQQTLNATAVDAVRALKKGGASEQSILLMVVLLGALGGSIHFVGSLVKFVGHRQLLRSWLMWYLSMPFAGAALAPVVYMLLRVGLLSPTGATGDGSTISNLNLIGIYAFAVLTGIFSKSALEKLGEVFKTLFRTAEPSRDRLSAKTSTEKA